MKRAFSLLEVIVAGALSLLLLVVLTRTLIPIMRHSRQSVAQLELSQLAHLISQRLLEDLQSAPSSAIHLPSSGSPTLFAIQPLERTTATGRPVYQDGLYIYSLRLEQGLLSRRLCTPADLSLDHPGRFTETQLNDFYLSAQQPARVLVSRVLREFSLTALSPHRPQMIHFHFLLGNNSKEYRFDEVVALRNGER